MQVKSDGCRKFLPMALPIIKEELLISAPHTSFSHLYNIRKYKYDIS